MENLDKILASFEDETPTHIPEYDSGPVKEVVDTLLSGKNVFLTGGGGVGKTYLTNLITKHPKIRAIKLATTGVAANLIGGQTLHRFFSLGISSSIEELRAYDKRNTESFGAKISESPITAHNILMSMIKRNLHGINVIVIDEISMASGTMIDMIHYRLLKSLKVDVRILYVGDFFQLPPVDNTGKAGMAFDSPHWDARIIELKEIKRTDNKEFSEIQHKIRYGEGTPEVIDYLRKMEKNSYDKNTLHLFSTNVEIDNHNLEKLRELPGDPKKVAFKFDEHKYKLEEAKKFIKDLLVNEVFYFKYGARVLFVTNAYDPDDGHTLWYNGEMGVLESFEAGSFIVTKDNGDTVTVPRHNFVREELKKGELVETMSIYQYPLRIAYAITIHKSQGLSLPLGHIDCNKFFLPEQFFVAISRFTDPNKLSLVGFKPNLIKKNTKVFEFYKNSSITYF